MTSKPPMGLMASSPCMVHVPLQIGNLQSQVLGLSPCLSHHLGADVDPHNPSRGIFSSLHGHPARPGPQVQDTLIALNACFMYEGADVVSVVGTVLIIGSGATVEGVGCLLGAEEASHGLNSKVSDE